MAKNKGGRPSTYSDVTAAAIVRHISVGMPVQVAALVAGVGYSTFYEWVKKYPEFREMVDKATATAEGRLVGIIAKAAEKTWTAAAWLLERHPKMRERWRRPDGTIAAPPVLDRK